MKTDSTEFYRDVYHVISMRVMVDAARQTIFKRGGVNSQICEHLYNPASSQINENISMLIQDAFDDMCVYLNHREM